MNLNYTVSDRAKRTTFILMGIGIVALILGFITDHAPEGVKHEDYHHTRFWANFLINSFFFMAIALATTFFLAMQYAAESAWSTSVKRVFEAITAYLPIGAIFMLIVFIAGALHLHHLYHWMDPNLYHEFLEDGKTPNPHYDEIIAGKRGYLNIPFFFIRSLAYIGIWIYFARLFRQRSLEEDMTGDLSIHFKNVKSAAIFLVIFGVTSSTAAWDWIMSIDTHWFSTLFGWYVFSGMWISAMITIVILTLYLKRKGYLEFVNESVIHDLGKWMFAISFLWSYLWFAQFMLIWYANIPEEVTYFMNRIENYKTLFFTVFFVNFALPMIFLMARDAKRNYGFLTTVGLIIFIGHWLDVYLLVMPGTVGDHWHIGFMEVGMFLGFLGLFMFVVLNALAKAPLMVKNHPFLDESIHHQI